MYVKVSTVAPMRKFFGHGEGITMGFLRHNRIAIILALLLPLSLNVAQGGESKAATAQKWFETGLLMMEAGNPRADDAIRRAIRDLDAYLGEKGADRSGRAAAYTLRSRCHSIQGDNAHALFDLDRAIELSPEDGENYYLRSFAEETAGNPEKSVVDLKTAARKGHQKARADLILKGIQ